MLPGCLLLLGLLVVDCSATFGAAGVGAHPPVASVRADASEARTSDIAGTACADPVLSSLLLSPNRAAVLGLESMTFVAEASSSCGTNLTNVTDFSWSLSSASLGVLSPTTGSATTYTACLATMGGLLHLTGTYDGVTVVANASISVSYELTNGSGLAGVSAGAFGGSTGRVVVGASVVAASVLGGTLIVVRVRRRGTRPAEAATEPTIGMKGETTDQSRSRGP